MRRLSQSSVLLCALAGLALLLGPSSGQAQEKAKKVSFTTADGVELSGTFFPGNKDSGTVMILHAIGEDSHKTGYDSLARVLQKQGFSVLTFDFRGHGDSTTVDPKKFWSQPANRLVKGNPAQPDTISVKDFRPEYYPILVNDIATAKGYLDRRNDAGECNTSALVVVGADTGATLGAIWMNSEWYRFKVLPPEVPTRPFPQVEGEPEGKGTVAAIFLSISPTLGKRTVPLSSVLNVPGRLKGVPMVFAYSAADKKGKTLAKGLEKLLKSGAKLNRHRFTGGWEIGGGGEKATGRDLLRVGQTQEQLGDYLQKILEKTPEWAERDFQKSMYIWMFSQPGRFGQIPPGSLEAKGRQEPTIRFNTYERFMR